MKKFIIGSALLLTPAIALAQTLDSILSRIGGLINAATPIVVALALLYFFWGLATYILSAGNDEKKSEGRNIMIWGVIALFVMVSVWGLVAIIAQLFGITPGGTIGIPFIQR
jgi:hypothetical protein